MQQQWQVVRSTEVIDNDAMLPFKLMPGVKHKNAYLCVFDSTKKAMYSDQTGRFPIVSSHGNKCLMIMVCSMGKRLTMWHSIPSLDHDTRDLLEYHQLHWYPKLKGAWTSSATNEFGWLAQGVKGCVKPTNTMFFIYKHEIPQDRFKDVIYIRFVCQI